MTVIGLTGGIASGKSTLSRTANERGMHVIDADVLGHKAYEPNTECFSAVVKEFGEDIVAEDGTIDRRSLGSKVFGDSEALKRLTDIVWPAIKVMASEEIKAVQSNDPDKDIMLEAAVLIEANWQDIVDEVWVVTVDEETAIRRIVGRDGIDQNAAKARIDSQISNNERVKHADVIIDNSGSESELQEKIALNFESLEAKKES